MLHLDLCTGIGGFHIAAQWAGFETVGFSEIEPYCCKLLAGKWPEIKNYGDLRTANFSEFRSRITVLSAGVPCQPSSVAGKRRGKEDDRWLWEAVLDVVQSVEPAWCIFENPPGILSLDEFRPILLRLESLKYEIRGLDVPANAVGADTEGYRVFIVAASMCAGLSPSGLQERHGETFTAAGRPVPKHVWLPTDPRVYGSFDGLPHRSHRLKALGNAVVPQQCFPFFRAIADTIRGGIYAQG